MARQREPNPYNTRARAVESALRDYAASARVHVSSISRAQAREILKERGLYSSEGSLSRDLAAIRKAQADFGGPRTAWARPNTATVVIDGQQYAATRWEHIPERVWRQGGYDIGVRIGGEIISVRVATGARDAGRARALALDAIYKKVADWRRKRQKRRGGGGWISRCQLCGMQEPELYDERYGWICYDCASRIEEEQEEEDSGGGDMWDQDEDTPDPDLDIRVLVPTERARWARYIS